MSEPQAMYVAGAAERLAELPEFLRSLLTRGECEWCGCPVAYHGPSRDDMATLARRTGRVLMTVCGPCGDVLLAKAQIGDGLAVLAVPADKLDRDLRRAKAERQ